MSKIALTGNASGTGTLTIAAPNTSTDRTLTLPDAAGTLDRLERAGNVLQVVTDTLEGYVSGTATGVPTSIANGVEVFSTSFTPISATSLILVQTSTVHVAESTNFADVLWMALWDGSTFIAATSGNPDNISYGSYLINQEISLNHSYSAGSTSTRTISVRAGANAGSGTFYVNGNSTIYTGSSRRIQMTVWEIAA